VFQIAHTTISPNYLGEEIETLDREILVVSTDVPPQDGETMNNAKSARMPTPPEQFSDKKSSPLPPQVQVNNRLTPDKSTTTPINKYLRHRLLLSSGATMIHLVPTDCVKETFSGILNATASKSTTLHRAT
jgi:hypothetical protein